MGVSKIPFEWQYKWETFADHLIVPSNYIKNIVTQGGMNPNDITVVPNGFDETIFNKKGSKLTKYGINPDKFNFLYVGNSQWRKGLDILINEWHGAFKAFDNAKLIIKDNPAIYGQNNVLNEIIKMQYKTGCGTVIYIDDELSDEDMNALYRSSKVLLFILTELKVLGCIFKKLWPVVVYLCCQLLDLTKILYHQT